MSFGTYRTKTYIAADWTGDASAVKALYAWKNNNHRELDFVDVHSVTQSRDSSLNCTIKSSLRQRMDISKTFVLIVGEKTKYLRSGGCQLCSSYNSYTGRCARGYSIDYKSYVDYECAKAVEAGIKIVVLYNSSIVNRDLCPDIVKNTSIHVPMHIWQNGVLKWNYQDIKTAIMG